MNIQCCIEEIVNLIENKKQSISNRELLEICKNFNFPEINKDETDPHIYHETAETALNKIIKTRYAKPLLSSSVPEREVKETLKPLMERLPTQTWRSEKQIIRQQFSTPPHIAYLLCYLVNLKPRETVLEPSAGTGSLAVWAAGAGLKTFTNETDARRRKFLEHLGFSRKAFNAEFINDFLTEDIRADVILMNPPFSSSGGRTANNSSKFGFRHVSSALERLEPGGKFGIILGESAGFDTTKGRGFWQKMSEKILVKACIKIPGCEYAKNGTRVCINLFIGKKRPKETEKFGDINETLPVSISLKCVEEGFSKARELNLRLD